MRGGKKRRGAAERREEKAIDLYSGCTNPQQEERQHKVVVLDSNPQRPLVSAGRYVKQRPRCVARPEIGVQRRVGIARTPSGGHREGLGSSEERAFDHGRPRRSERRRLRRHPELKISTKLPTHYHDHLCVLALGSGQGDAPGGGATSRPADHPPAES